MPSLKVGAQLWKEGKKGYFPLKISISSFPSIFPENARFVQRVHRPRVLCSARTTHAQGRSKRRGFGWKLTWKGREKVTGVSL